MPKNKQINCQCPTCDTKILIDVDIKQKGVNTCNNCYSPFSQPGPQGPRGLQGSVGNKGYKGSIGPVGPMGLQGFQGVTGVTGLQGALGLMGSTGNQGPSGATGTGNRWFLGFDCTPTGTNEQPNDGDYLLDLNSCEICQFTNGGWTGTGQTLNCLTCDDVYNCLKALPKIDENHGNCNVTLIINELASVFSGAPIQITQLVIADSIQDISAISGMTFTNPNQLFDLLKLVSSDWQYTQAFQTNLYLLQLTISGSIANTESYISFNNGSLFNMNLQCFCPPEDVCLPCSEVNSSTRVLTCQSDQVVWIESGCLGLTGPTGATGLMGSTGLQGMTGATGLQGNQGPQGSCSPEIICGYLKEDIPEPDATECEFCGLFDPNCFVFLENITQTYFIATAYNSPSNLVSSLVEFSNQSEYDVALNMLNIVVVDNLMKVTQSPSKINRVYYFNSSSNLIASVTLFPVNCCPENIDENNQVLTKIEVTGGTGGYNLAWVPAHCLSKPDIDISEEINKLTPCFRFRCCVLFDITQPFLNNNSLTFNFPWYLQEVILFGNNVTVDYSGLICNFKDLAEILKDNGWTQAFEGSSKYRYCFSSDSPITDLNMSIRIADTNDVTFFCIDEEDGLIPECSDTQELAPNDIQLIYKTNNGVFLGNASKLLETFDICDTVTYTCQTLMPIDCILNDLTISGPWKFREINLSGLNQTLLNQSFSNRSELEIVLINLGWVSNGNGVYSITQSNIDLPSSNMSFAIIESVNDSSLTQTINLENSCSANCGSQTGVNRLVLTRDGDENFCWISPECLRTGSRTVFSCCTGCTGGCDLDKIPDCAIDVKHDISIIIRHCVIDLIKCHFNESVGPYWIVGYRLDNGDVLPIEKEIDNPFSLKTLVEALTDVSLDNPWITDVTISDIDDKTEKVRLTLKNSCNYVHAILINELGEFGVNTPFNYILPIDNVISQECPGLSKDAKVMIKEGTGYCFVDLDCLVPVKEPEKDLSKELCHLGDCEGEVVLKACIRLDECDIQKLINTFGTTKSLEIVEYRLVNDYETGESQLPIIVNKVIGVNPTLNELIGAFLDLGWTTGDISERPIILDYVTTYNINYVVINRVGAFESFTPYPYLIPASCSRDFNCPSTDPLNQMLIKNPEGRVCWTPICPVRGPKGRSVEGPTGPQGVTGIQGMQGITGLQGVTGLQGFQGMRGERGDPGPQGTTGTQGFQGVTGLQGEQGPTGAIGPTGERGFQGATGLQGPTGLQGFQGVTGLQGSQGVTGFQGELGVTGSIGPTGPPGPMGVIGNPGMQGVTGLQGSTGVQGPTGNDATAQNIDGINLGNAAEIFAGKSGNDLEFRTLEEGENINITQSVDEISVAVSDTFDWGNTLFVGGTNSVNGAASVEAGSSLTFNNGAVLFTNNIEETTSGTGITFDTSNGNGGVNIRDGGIRFENNTVGSDQGITSTSSSRFNYLEYFFYDCFNDNFSFPSSSPGPIITIGWQRIGNSVTMYLPNIDPTQITNSSGGPATASNLGTIPTAIRPTNDVSFVIVVRLLSNWQTHEVTITSAGKIVISQYNGVDFNAGDDIENHATSITWNITPP